MPTSTFLARQPAAPSSTPEVGTTMWLLHTWNHHGDETEVYFSYDDAVHTLASRVRDNWANRMGPSTTPKGLSDGAAVSLFYDSEISEAPTVCEHIDDGFEIVEHQVYGREPERVERRMATLRVFDEHPDGPQYSPLTYRVDAIGLAITITAGMHGPFVAIGNESLPAGTALHVAADDFEEWER
ncbi:hypothetical protein [Haloechinothrix halophila]|uniref:hypothetical protein n=1 Tax=Haloechinothrix halophila TaxID=1069073 RepID=UPI0003FD3DC8|nr:hypothetical protein [Haloechinothrix halophila]